MNIIDWLKSLFKKSRPLPNSWDVDNEKIDEKDAIFDTIFGAIEFGGASSKDWRGFMPTYEQQGFGDCVSFSRTNCAESKSIIEGSLDPDGNQWNFSDLDLAVGSGTTLSGNTMKAVSEYFRKIGISLEKDCPYTYNWSSRQAIFNAAKDKPKYKGGNWSWVKTNIDSLKTALNDGPIQIGIGLSSNYNQVGPIKDPKKYSAYHAVTLCYIDADDRLYIFDHYDITNKILDTGYTVQFAMSFKDLPENWKGINVSEDLFYKRMIGKLVLRVEKDGELYRVYDNFLQKVNFAITDKQLFDETTKEYWGAKKKFTGISEKDFARLEKMAFTMEGIKEPEETINNKGLLIN